MHGNGNKETLDISKGRLFHAAIWFSDLCMYTRNICRAILRQLYISLDIQNNEYMHDQLNE